MLQQHKLLKVIKKKLVRKALDMFKKMSKEDYQKFWKEYSTSVKLGIIEDPSNKTRLAKLLRCVCVCVSWGEYIPEVNCFVFHSIPPVLILFHST